MLDGSVRLRLNCDTRIARRASRDLIETHMAIKRIAGSLAFLLFLLCSGARAQQPDAAAIIKTAIKY